MNETERILAVLESLDARLARLESHISPVVEQVEPTVAVVVDTVDGLIGQLQAGGIDIDARLRATLSLAERLSRPETADNLRQAVDIAEQAPAMIATVTDTVDGLIGQLQASGVDIDVRLRATLALTERLSRPETMASLGQALDIAEQLPALIATTVDTIDSVIARIQGQGIDIDARIAQILRAAELLSHPSVVDMLAVLSENSVPLHAALSSLMESGVLSNDAVQVVGNAARALVSSKEAPENIGAFVLLRSLSDPDVARAVSFGREFARRFGQTLSA